MFVRNCEYDNWNSGVDVVDFFVLNSKNLFSDGKFMMIGMVNVEF